MSVERITSQVAAIDIPDLAWREAALAAGRREFDSLYAEALCLHQIEVRRHGRS